MSLSVWFRGPIVRLGWTLSMLTLGISLHACSGANEMQPKKMTDDLKSDLELIAATRIYFGHQSVGGNIIAGLDDLQSQRGEPLLRIAEVGDLSVPQGQGVFIHTKVGENENPASKCTDFRRVLDEQLKGDVDVALLKFCYIDFNENTDVEQVFASYKDVIEDLKQRYPNTIFIHVTAPLRYSASGLGIWAREMLGRPNRSKLANVSRNEFNRRLRETFPADPFFDLAASESTYPDGAREYFTMSGVRYYSLVGEYTDDGGHLNEIGRTHVAADFVKSIADAIRVARKST